MSSLLFYNALTNFNMCILHYCALCTMAQLIPDKHSYCSTCLGHCLRNAVLGSLRYRLCYRYVYPFVAIPTSSSMHQQRHCNTTLLVFWGDKPQMRHKGFPMPRVSVYCRPCGFKVDGSSFWQNAHVKMTFLEGPIKFSGLNVWRAGCFTL